MTVVVTSAVIVPDPMQGLICQHTEVPCHRLYWHQANLSCSRP